MSEKRGILLMSMEAALEQALTDLQSVAIHSVDMFFDEKNIQKLKSSMAYQSALYFDALAHVH